MLNNNGTETPNDGLQHDGAHKYKLVKTEWHEINKKKTKMYVYECMETGCTAAYSSPG